MGKEIRKREGSTSPPYFIFVYGGCKEDGDKEKDLIALVIHQNIDVLVDVLINDELEAGPFPFFRQEIEMGKETK